ncbi:MAG TPA: hypothetical protein VJM32_03330 [Candidatus Saccharimonadales bacterium]|nr:hypothetical protein [Candidatus Saccharimonadales bacterium]
MPRRAMEAIRAERASALALLDETVAAAAAEVSASAAIGLAYRTEMEEIDDTITRLRARRGELYGLNQQHPADHHRLKQTAYKRVNELCNIGEVPTSQKLAIAVEVVFGAGNPAILTALREGRRLLRTLDDEPFLCHGYARLLQHGLWFGARTTGPPRIDLVTHLFCIVVPLVADGHKEVCNIPIEDLAQHTGAGFESRTQAHIGDEDIAACLKKKLAGRDPESRDYANARAALAHAGYTAEQGAVLLNGVHN